jgi:hypothetical protein
MSETPTVLYCANHPNTATSLRCNRCEKPICPRCAVSTPTGYRCKECVRAMKKTFETAEWYDFPVAFFIVMVLAYLGSRLVSFVGFFTIFIAPMIGVGIAEVVRLAVHRRRSDRLYRVVAIAAVLGGLPQILILLFMGAAFNSFQEMGVLLPLLWHVIYVFTLVSTVYYRLSGIQLRR